MHFLEKVACPISCTRHPNPLNQREDDRHGRPAFPPFQIVPRLQRQPVEGGGVEGEGEGEADGDLGCRLSGLSEMGVGLAEAECDGHGLTECQPHSLKEPGSSASTSRELTTLALNIIKPCRKSVSFRWTHFVCSEL